MLRPHKQNNLWELEQAFCLKTSFGLECNVPQKQRRTLIPYFKLSYTSGLTWFHLTTRYISFWLEVIQAKWTVFRNIVTLYWQIPPQIQNANTNWIKTFYNRASFFNYHHNVRAHIKCRRILTKCLDVRVHHDDEVDLGENRNMYFYYTSLCRNIKHKKI